MKKKGGLAVSASRERIAKRVAYFFKNGDLANLGIGGTPRARKRGKDVTNDGSQPATIALEAV